MTLDSELAMGSEDLPIPQQFPRSRHAHIEFNRNRYTTVDGFDSVFAESEIGIGINHDNVAGDVFVASRHRNSARVGVGCPQRSQ